MGTRMKEGLTDLSGLQTGWGNFHRGYFIGGRVSLWRGDDGVIEKDWKPELHGEKTGFTGEMSDVLDIPSHLRQRIHRFWHKWSLNVTDYDPCYKGTYLGNVLTIWAKGDGCIEKPLSALWDNYCSNNDQSDVVMKLTVCNSGLKVSTKEHGETEYWAYRITYCNTHPSYPKVFCWVYRHECEPLKHEIRCHAVLCSKEEKAQQLSKQLNEKLVFALQEFRREKLSRQKNRLSLANPVFPRRKLMLSTGAANFRPRANSLLKMTSIEEEEKDE